MFGIIVVGTDGSLTADRAVARASELAVLGGDVLHIVCAYRSAPGDGPGPGEESDTAPADGRAQPGAYDEARATLRSAAVLARQIGVEAHTHASPGDAAAAILGAARHLDAGVIVVGSKGVERRILGSVPAAVTRDAGCDVLVVRTT